MALVAATINPGKGLAVEVGNVFGTAVAESRSSQASILLLEGIQRIFAGLLQREARQGSGAEEFSSARELLGKAAQQMYDLAKDPDFPEVQFDAGQKQFLAERLRRDDPFEARLVEAPDLRTAYAALGDVTNSLAETTSTLGDRQNAFREVRGPLSRLFWIADTLVAVQNR